MAYTIVKTLFEKKRRPGRRPQGGGEHRAQESEADARPIPFHPGAKKYFDGTGRQSQLIRAPGDRSAMPRPPHGDAAADAETGCRRRAAAARRGYIEEEEGDANRFGGWLGVFATLLAVGMSLFHLYAAVEIVPAQVLRPVHVGWTLLLVSCFSRSPGGSATA